MSRYSNDALSAMLDGPESHSTKRIGEWAGGAPERARETVCAFANDMPGTGQAGVLFVGVRRDGTPSGLPITDDLLRDLAQLATDETIAPPPVLSVERRTIRGHDVAVVTVEPSAAPPVRYRGQTCIRTGPRRDVATAQDERILSEKRRVGNRPFDTRPVR